jgi:hypothetical protein
MRALGLYSEPFAETGNMAAEGFKRLLGRPTLDLLQTMIREGIQNVADASSGNVGPRVIVRLRTLACEQSRILRESVFRELPKADATREELKRVLAQEGIRVLELCDFGTQGLSGPTRADAPHDGAEPLNFVNFLRNVGAARDTHHGGGTYGYGKSSLYALSGCSTIIVDSQTHSAGQPQRRLMACHLGGAFDATGSDGIRRRYTGRHWWGDTAGASLVEPAIDDTARPISDAIGLPPRDESQTGTSILILDPLLGSEDLRSTVDQVIETVLWNFWPRMTRTTSAHRRITVHVELEGERMQVPDPEEFPPLDLYAEAMAAHRNDSKELQEIRSERPKRLLGKLSIQKGLRVPRRGPAARAESTIPTQSAHIALMRPVELVVKYLPGEAFPDRRFEWAGVFICSDADEVEDAFAQAEPPAHDDWIPDNLPKGQAKTMVRVALREIDQIAKTHANPAIVGAAAKERGPSLAATATKMGAFLDRVSASGPGRAPSRPGLPSARKSLTLSAARFADLYLDESGRAIARFTAELQNDGSDPSLRIVAEPHLVLDGGYAGTDDLPGGVKLDVVGMKLGELRKSSEGPWLVVGAQAGTIEVMIPTIAGVAIGVKLQLQSRPSK